MTNFILRPLPPPASLMAAAAAAAPRFFCSPIEATGPVIGPATAMVRSSAKAGAAPRASAASEMLINFFMVNSSLFGCEPIRAEAADVMLCAAVERQFGGNLADDARELETMSRAGRSENDAGAG